MSLNEYEYLNNSEYQQTQTLNSIENKFKFTLALVLEMTDGNHYWN